MPPYEKKIPDDHLNIYIHFFICAIGYHLWEKRRYCLFDLPQVSLTNWAAEGQHSVAINASLGVFANRVKNRSKWESSLGLAYGFINQEESSGFSKSDDLINLVTKYGYKMNTPSVRLFSLLFWILGLNLMTDLQQSVKLKGSLILWLLGILFCWFRGFI